MICPWRILGDSVVTTGRTTSIAHRTCAFDAPTSSYSALKFLYVLTAVLIIVVAVNATGKSGRRCGRHSRSRYRSEGTLLAVLVLAIALASFYIEECGGCSFLIPVHQTNVHQLLQALLSILIKNPRALLFSLVLQPATQPFPR
jgi:hypothetical protein